MLTIFLPSEDSVDVGAGPRSHCEALPNVEDWLNNDDRIKSMYKKY